MARAGNAPNQSIGFGRGVVNRLSEDSLPEGAAREVENFDIRPTGGLVRRSGYTAVAGLSGGHSLWAWPGFPGWLYVSGSSLIHIDAQRSGSTVATVTRGLPMSYAYHAGRVYYSNGVDMGIVTGTGTCRRWGFATPPAPALSATAGGFPAGRYHVAWTAVYDDGEESAPSRVSLIALVSAGGIQISAVPAATGATALRVYRSYQDGEELYHAATISLPHAGAYTLLPGDVGEMTRTLHHDPMRAGAPIAIHNRRIYTARGRYLQYSSDLQLSLTKRRAFWLPFPEPIRMLAAVSDGLYVGTSAAVYWVPGPDPDEAALTVIDRHGCLSQPNQAWIPGTAFPAQGVPPTGPVAAWIAADGSLCVGRPGGFVQRVTESTVALPSAGRVAMSYFDADGIRQLRIAFDGYSANPRATTDSPVTTVFQQGVDTTDSTFLITEGGDSFITEGGDRLIAE